MLPWMSARSRSWVICRSSTDHARRLRWRGYIVDLYLGEQLAEFVIQRLIHRALHLHDDRNELTLEIECLEHRWQIGVRCHRKPLEPARHDETIENVERR